MLQNEASIQSIVFCCQKTQRKVAPLAGVAVTTIRVQNTKPKATKAQQSMTKEIEQSFVFLITITLLIKYIKV